MTMKISVNHTSSVQGLSSPFQGDKYADSFVYAAANNQISIVARRLGLNEVSGDSGFVSGPEVRALPVVEHADVRTKDGQTALSAAARGGHVDVINLLIDNGADVGAKNLTSGPHDGGGYSALHIAANWGKAGTLASDHRSCLPCISSEAADFFDGDIASVLRL
jgi:hypothetical protein